MLIRWKRRCHRWLKSGHDICVSLGGFFFQKCSFRCSHRRNEIGFIPDDQGGHTICHPRPIYLPEQVAFNSCRIPYPYWIMLKICFNETTICALHLQAQLQETPIEQSPWNCDDDRQSACQVTDTGPKKPARNLTTKRTLPPFRGKYKHFPCPKMTVMDVKHTRMHQTSYVVYSTP